VGAAGTVAGGGFGFARRRAPRDRDPGCWGPRGV